VGDTLEKVASAGVLIADARCCLLVLALLRGTSR
jgi:hypothetical protein